MTVQVTDLGGEWTLTALNPACVPADIRQPLMEGIPAAVPGEATIDLLRNDLIAQPFDGDNEGKQQWIGDVDWQFSRDFDWQPAQAGDAHQRVDLVAQGLDTFATVLLNGRPVAQTDDYYLTYRWDVRDFLHEGRNQISVLFSSPVAQSERLEQSRGYYPHVEHHAFNQVRMPSSSFGWDWGIDIANAGITGSLTLETWSQARVDSVRPLATVRADGAGLLDVAVKVERAAHLTPANSGQAAPVTATISLDGFGQHAETTAVLGDRSSEIRASLELPTVKKWWPIGYGQQPLYTVSVSLSAGEEMPQAGSDPDWQGQVGFRTVRVDTVADQVGRPFQLYVNEVPIHARGFNWIPDNAFLSQIKRSDYERGMRDLVESNSNMVRVWGGGLYESEDFYRLADQLGIMVWQDFMLACAAYPEDAHTKELVEREAVQAISRLSAHPSLIVWNGSNENYIAYQEWGGFKNALVDDDLPAGRYGYGEKGWGDYYYSQLFPALLGRLEGADRVAYLASSPMSFADYTSPNSDKDGTMHIWDVWNREDYHKFLDYIPRFADEFGYQAPPAFSTLTRYVHDQPLDPFGKQMLVHQKAIGGNEKLAKGMRSHLTPGNFDDVSLAPDGSRSWLIPSDHWADIEDWHWACQLQQAKAIEFGVAHMRSLEPLNAGALIWQLNDDWPVVSWAAVDFEGHRKPAWYAAQQVFAPLFATIQPRLSDSERALRSWEGKSVAPDKLALILVNDSAADWSGRWVIRRQSLEGAVLAEQSVQVRLPAQSQAQVYLDAEVARFGEPARELVVASPVADSATASAPGQAVGQTAGQTLPAFARVILNGAEVIEQDLQAQPFEAVAGRAADGQGYLLTVTARSYVRDLFCLADKVDPLAVVKEGLVSLLPGEQAVFHINSQSLVDPSDFAGPRVLRSANDLRPERGGVCASEIPAVSHVR